MGNKVVYIHKRKDTNKVFYVGIGSKYRPYTQRKNTMWNGIVKKYGYEVEILYQGLEWEEAILIERYLICHLGRKDKGKGYLANMTDGGEGNQNMIYTDEWREKQRISSMGRKQNTTAKLKKSLALTGKKFTEERKNNISKSKKGQLLGEKNPATNLTEEKVIQIKRLFLEGNSKLSISKQFNCGWTTVARIIKGETWSHIKVEF